MFTTKTLLDRTRILNQVVQSQAGGTVRFDDLVKALSTALEAKVAIVSRKGKVLAATEGFSVSTGAIFDEGVQRSLFSVEEATAMPLTLAGRAGNEAFSTTVSDLVVLPIFGGGNKLGTLLVNHNLDEYGLVLAEYASTVCGLALLHAYRESAQEENLKHSAARMAVQALSYSETEALAQVFGDLGGMEGLVVASKIADRAGVTRSVIVNGLRKLESAGVIKSKSLGMKGTYIKVLNESFLEELRGLN